MATEIRPGYRCEAPSMVGRVPAAREKSRPIVLLGLCTEANYKIRYLLTRMKRLTDLCVAPQVPILRGGVLEDLVHRPYHFCLHLKMSLAPVVQRHTVSS